MTEVSSRRLLGIALALALGTAPITAHAETGAVPVIDEGEQGQVTVVALASDDNNAQDTVEHPEATSSESQGDDGTTAVGSEGSGIGTDSGISDGSGDDPAIVDPEPEPDPEPKPEPEPEVEPELAAGPFFDEGKLYLRLPDGSVLKGAGWHQLDGSWYYAKSANGALATGWKKLGGKWYWFDPDEGTMATGVTTADGARYLFSPSGAMLTGWQKSHGAWFYSNSSGILQTGWKKLSGVWYYLDPETGQMATGWAQVDGARYYFNTSGAMQTGWKKLGGKWYYLNPSGALATGWKKLAGTWYLLDSKTGAMATGWKKDGQERYYLNSSGAMQTGWKQLRGTWYYFGQSGALATGWTKAGGKWYWLDEKTGAMYTGWLKQDGTWYWLASSGAAAQNQIAIVNGLGYAFDSSCACHYGNVKVPQSSLTKKQQAIVNACSKVPSPGKGLCAAWVTGVFESCGYASLNLDACDMANQYCKTSDLSKLKPGMMIAVRKHSHTWAGSIWGHVCIYIGNGKVMDNAGTIRIIDLGSWLYWYGDSVTPKWGWYDNKSLV
ncbi:MAG: hypothetical protein Q4D48_07830 [Coriobacteriales bacterium]|nr:hypothetical protein [Coriobacteriales bacterium]